MLRVFLQIACFNTVSVVASIVLDNTGTLGPTQGASSTRFQGGSATGSSAPGLWSNLKYGYTFTTTTAVTLSRLDVALNAGAGGTTVVDFLVEVWTAVTSNTGFSASPILTAHAIGTVPAFNTWGYTSLVLPGFMRLTTGTFALTFSPQTNSVNKIEMFGFVVPSVGAGVVLLNDSFYNGSTWTSPSIAGTKTFGGFRLLDAGGVSFAATLPWTDQQSGNTASRSDFTSNISVAGAVAVFGVSVPNDGSAVGFGLTEFSVCVGTKTNASFGANAVFLTLFLYAPTVATTGRVRPTGSAVLFSSATAVPAMSNAAAYCSIPLDFMEWALTYTPVTPYVFLVLQMTGPSVGDAVLCGSRTGATLDPSDSWGATGIGGVYAGSSISCMLVSPHLLIRMHAAYGVSSSLATWAGVDFLNAGPTKILPGVKVRCVKQQQRSAVEYFPPPIPP